MLSRHCRFPTRCTHLDSATRAITSALTGPVVPPTGPPPPSLITSIQLLLHQVFLFAMTAAGPDRKAQEELGGLIQVLWRALRRTNR
ncbi:hypothetical protein BJY52DRAFT_1233347 [Lactarius psammicola]|nr:hypothetical protein BJY52DRAFT_1233347 [Lactarius psammicola]